MSIFKRKNNINQNDKKINDLDKRKNLPTYYEEYAKNIEVSNNFHRFQLVSGDLDQFEIYYYGDLLKKHFIVGSDDARSLVVAKDKNGKEIIIFDGFIHGYDNMIWQEYDEKEKGFKRELTKLDIGLVKVYIGTEFLDDTEDDFDLDENRHVITDHNKKIPWDIFKRNAITWLTIDVVTERNKKINIVDEELA